MIEVSRPSAKARLPERDLRDAKFGATRPMTARSQLGNSKRERELNFHPSKAAPSPPHCVWVLFGKAGKRLKLIPDLLIRSMKLC